MRRYNLDVITAWRQLIVVDGVDQHDCMSQIPDIAEQDFRRRIKACDELIVVYTARQGMSQIIFEIHDIEPNVDLLHWDHVVECGLYVPSRCIDVLGLDSSQPYAQIELEFVNYRVRIHQGNLATISSDRMHGQDFYLLTLWPSSKKDLIVLKQYEYPC